MLIGVRSTSGALPLRGHPTPNPIQKKIIKIQYLCHKIIFVHVLVNACRRKNQQKNEKLYGDA